MFFSKSCETIHVKKTYFDTTVWQTPVHKNRTPKTTTCKTFHGCFGELMKVFHESPDTEGHQFSMKPAGSGEDDQF